MVLSKFITTSGYKQSLVIGYLRYLFLFTLSPCIKFCSQSAMSSLHHLLKCLDPDITDSEAVLAEGNLIGFFRKLETIEQRLTREESVSDSNQRYDEAQHENYGS